MVRCECISTGRLNGWPAIVSIAALVFTAGILFTSFGCGDPITKYEEPAGPYTIYFEPGSLEVSQDVPATPVSVTLELYIEKVTDLFGVDLVVHFQGDSALDYIQVKQIQEGVLLNEAGMVPTLFLSQHPINSDYLRIQAVRLNGSGITTYEPGHLATLQLELGAKGVVELSWRECRLYNSAKPVGDIIDPENHVNRNALLRIL